MFKMLLVSFLIALCSSQTYQVSSYFSSVSCLGGTQVGFSAVKVVCTPNSAVCNGGVSTQCVTGAPSNLAGSLYYAVYDVTNCGGGSPTNLGSYLPNQCFYTSSTTSGRAQCTGSNFERVLYTNIGCTNAQSSLVYPSGCVTTGTSSTFGSCIGGGGGSNVCFHKTTQIQYINSTEILTYNDIIENREPHCLVPHLVRSSGVAIKTTCTTFHANALSNENSHTHQHQHLISRILRLTHNHLVFTSTGLVSAGSLNVNDIIYEDINQRHACRIVSIEEEYDQEYFGLNCLESVVLANGYKASTFGSLHYIPSYWMKYASKFIGLKRASKFGDMISNTIHYFGLI